MDNPLCQCGCGKPVRMSHHKYVVGHNRRGKTNPKTQRVKKWMSLETDRTNVRELFV